MKAMEDTIREARELAGEMPPLGWEYLGHNIYIQAQERFELSHPNIHLLMSFQPPDWSCFVDGKLVGLNFATAFYVRAGHGFLSNRTRRRHQRP
jgi:hypothetical protein